MVRLKDTNAAVVLLIALYLFVNSVSPKTYFMQALFEHQMLEEVKKELAPAINNIVKQELRLTPDYSFEFFIPKPRQMVTLYYAYDVAADGEKTFFHALEASKLPPVESAHLTSEINFFGEQDELVVMVQDEISALSNLNRAIKEVLHKASATYKAATQTELYNIAKSERFPYAPHIGLGRLRTMSITKHIKDATQVAATFERIRSRIKAAVADAMRTHLAKQSPSLAFNKLQVMDFARREYIKEIVLEA